MSNGPASASALGDVPISASPHFTLASSAVMRCSQVPLASAAIARQLPLHTAVSRMLHTGIQYQWNLRSLSCVGQSNLHAQP